MLLDVPGHSLRSRDNRDSKKLLMNIIEGKEPYGKEIGKHTESSKPERKIHTIVSIQKGTVQIEELHSRLRDAAKSLGEAIPMFFVITHIDKMTEEQVNNMIADLKLAIGLDESVIFTVANSDTKTGLEHQEDPQKKMYMRRVLRRVLGASKEYKKSHPEQESFRFEPTSRGACQIM
ncbi:uncharacterized protein [Ptychodera flava]|uniref:uncharacterized protein n=1 Tax=Ptychodera flava TaxID=63121 RepID=UPI00396A28FA